MKNITETQLRKIIRTELKNVKFDIPGPTSEDFYDSVDLVEKIFRAWDKDHHLKKGQLTKLLILLNSFKKQVENNLRK